MGLSEGVAPRCLPSVAVNFIHLSSRTDVYIAIMESSIANKGVAVIVCPKPLATISI